ncbi:MAG: hypothetical protein J6386_18455 [Candidatus Synoicihabitans palmerolidicus]|nr:hypothetical protein [Candidatus Synoicihabitans palmerolidicus]
MVAAADFDAAQLTKMGKDEFGGIERPAESLPIRDEGKLVVSGGLRAGSFRIRDVGFVRAAVASVAPLPSEPDSAALRVKLQQANFVQALLGERLSDDLLPTPGGDAGAEVILGHRAAMASVMADPKNWEKNVGAMDQMIRTTYRWGFESAEYEPLRQRQLRMAELMADLFPRSDPHEVCQGLLSSLVENRVYVGPIQEFAWMRDWLREVTAEELLAVYR